LDSPIGIEGSSQSVLAIFQRSITNLAEDVKRYVKSADFESLSIDKEKQYYHEISDIREEISMIKSVLSEQEEVWKDFTLKVWPEKWKDGRFEDTSNLQYVHGAAVLSDNLSLAQPQAHFEKYKREMQRLEENVKRVEDLVKNHLDLKQKYASMSEAHSAAILGTLVFGFTIITIIFTPLSFAISVFGLPIDRLQGKQIVSRWTNDAGMYTTNYIGKYIG
jgi:Mg2+ and Co2+ transporter CorA